MFKISSFGTNARLETFVSLVTLCMPTVNNSDVLIMVSFRVWSDLCSNLNFGLIWQFANEIICLV